MSAYIVEDLVIHQIVSFLHHDRDAQHIRRELGERWKLHPDGNELCERLGLEMVLLNRQAVNVRYRETEIAQPYRFSYKLTSDLQAFKSLRCWMYQCSEGDLPETSDLYKTMRELRLSWAESIIDKHVPAYAQTLWI